MKLLSIGVALFGLLALVLAGTGKDVTMAVLGVAALICAFTTFRSTAMSSFLKIFVGTFSTETTREILPAPFRSGFSGSHFHLVLAAR